MRILIGLALAFLASPVMADGPRLIYGPDCNCFHPWGTPQPTSISGPFSPPGLSDNAPDPVAANARMLSEMAERHPGLHAAITNGEFTPGVSYQ